MMSLQQTWTVGLRKTQLKLQDLRIPMNNPGMICNRQLQIVEPVHFVKPALKPFLG
jgi:hypothetical protein